ncbi:MAG: hypothetical protein KL863_19740 [Rhizobium sp.]|nr:hypothetical protein [Rhizobium sp.]
MRIAAAITIIALCLPAASLAADKLPLKRGIFVDTDVKCAERSNATVVSFWGDQLNTARTIGTISRVVKKGKSYTVDLDIEHMDGGKVKTTWSLVIRNPRTLKVTNSFGSWNHRWCSDQM